MSRELTRNERRLGMLALTGLFWGAFLVAIGFTDRVRRDRHRPRAGGGCRRPPGPCHRRRLRAAGTRRGRLVGGSVACLRRGAAPRGRGNRRPSGTHRLGREARCRGRARSGCAAHGGGRLEARTGGGKRRRVDRRVARAGAADRADRAAAATAAEARACRGDAAERAGGGAASGRPARRGARAERAGTRNLPDTRRPARQGADLERARADPGPARRRDRCARLLRDRRRAPDRARRQPRRRTGAREHRRASSRPGPRCPGAGRLERRAGAARAGHGRARPHRGAAPPGEPAGARPRSPDRRPAARRAPTPAASSRESAARNLRAA